MHIRTATHAPAGLTRGLMTRVPLLAALILIGVAASGPGQEPRKAAGEKSPFDRLDPDALPVAARPGKQHDHIKGLVAVLRAEGSVCRVAISPDGKWVAARAGAFVYLWDAATARQVARLEGHTGNVAFLGGVAFSPDGKTLVSSDGVGGENTVRFWRMGEKGATATTTLERPRATRELIFSADGKTLVMAQGSHVELWDVGGDEPKRRHTIATPARTVALAPDGKTLATGGDSTTVSLWDLSEGKPELRPEGELEVAVGQPAGVKGWIASLAFSPDGKTLACGGFVRPETNFGDDNNVAQLWDLSGKKPKVRLALPNGSSLIAFSPDGTTFVGVGMIAVRLNVWDADGELRFERKLRQDKNWLFEPEQLVFAPDGRHLVLAGTHAKEALVVRLSAGRAIPEPKPEPEPKPKPLVPDPVPGGDKPTERDKLLSREQTLTAQITSLDTLSARAKRGREDAAKETREAATEGGRTQARFQVAEYDKFIEELEADRRKAQAELRKVLDQLNPVRK